jgi:hypothetical protein
MKLARIAATLALLAIPVSAFLARPAQAQADQGQGGQMPHLNMLPDEPSKTEEQKEQEAIRDKAYKESLRKIPDAKTSNDPWGGVRSDTPKSTTAPASKTTASSKKTKTGSSAN